MTTRLALIGFDGTPAAARAIAVAGELLAGCEALVLTVAIPADAELPLDPLGDIVGRLSGIYKDWDEIAGEIATHHAEAGCRLAGEAGLSARPLTAVGKPAPTILRVADEHDVALIVVGSGGHGALAGLLGSVSARVVAQAERSVLVVPGPAADR